MEMHQFHENWTYYEGFEGEEQVILRLETDPSCSIHIWIGYFDGILRNPDLSGDGWIGFTRDYHQTENAFAQSAGEISVEPAEYLADLLQYEHQTFDTAETRQVLDLIIRFLKHAIHEKARVIVSVE